MKKTYKFLSLFLCVLMVFSCFGIAVSAVDPDTCEHEFTLTPFAPTCGEKGYVLHTCSKCGYYYKSDETPALGHSFPSTWETISKATCTEEGLQQRQCTRSGCSAYETKTIPVLVHKDDNADGKCDLCGEKMDTKIIIAPFDWLKAFFKAVVEWFRAIFA